MTSLVERKHSLWAEAIRDFIVVVAIDTAR